MELQIDRLTKQYGNKIAVDRISLKLQGKKDPNEGKKSFDEEEDI